MRVLVVGGYGLIGGHVVTELVTQGCEVIGVGRGIEEASRRFPDVRWIRADITTASAEAWAPILEGVDAVVNCAGALQDNLNDDLMAVHVTGLVILAQAAHRAGVRRFVHISAAGVESSPGVFGRTKRDAESALQDQDIDWIVLRPGLVLSPTAFGGSALLRGLAAFPWFVPAVYPDSLIQVVDGGEVGGAVVTALQPGAPSRLAIDLVSDESYRLRDILAALRGWLGRPGAPVISIPFPVARATALAADALGWLGWRSPMRTAAILQLRHGVRGDAGPAAALLGIRPRGLAALLAASPSSVQERWFSSLYFIKPLGLATLAIFWLASGIIGLIHADQATAVLTVAGFTASMAKTSVVSGAAADIVLGGLVCFRRFARLALKGMVGVTLAYLVGATVWRPDLWADPLGPLTKVVPAAVLALALMGMMDDR